LDDFSDPQRLKLLGLNSLNRPTGFNSLSISQSYDFWLFKITPRVVGSFFTQSRCAIDTFGFEGISFRYFGPSPLLTIRYHRLK
jgi:hypothetical protein